MTAYAVSNTTWGETTIANTKEAASNRPQLVITQ
jgi:hypothetical protein